MSGSPSENKNILETHNMSTPEYNDDMAQALEASPDNLNEATVAVEDIRPVTPFPREFAADFTDEEKRKILELIKLTPTELLAKIKSVEDRIHELCIREKEENERGIKLGILKLPKDY